MVAMMLIAVRYSQIPKPQRKRPVVRAAWPGENAREVKGRTPPPHVRRIARAVTIRFHPQN